MKLFHQLDVPMQLFLKNSFEQIEPALFENSLFKRLNITGTSFNAQVNIEQKNATLSVSNTENSDNKHLFRAPLGRSPHCPMIKFGSLSQEARDAAMKELNSSKRKFEHVAVAVSLLLENKRTKHVLLTRRAKTMRTFPHVWVTPGGGIEDSDIDIYDTVKRELEEETGVVADESNFEPIAMWESVFPTFFHQGTPTRHHLVLYMLASIDLFDDGIEKAYDHLKPQLEEVDAIAWLDYEKVKKVVEWSERGEVIPNTDENTFTACDQDRNLVTMYLSQLQTIEPKVENEDQLEYTEERLSLGTIFALKQWLNKYQ